MTITDDMSTETKGLGPTSIFGAQVHAHPLQPKEFSDPQDMEFDLSRADLFSAPINYGMNEHVAGVDYVLVDTLPLQNSLMPAWDMGPTTNTAPSVVT